ncbi:uncharacterized protein, partial [Littorina saxatilis]|uniref:uncharacterized protein n=1 Tax=Littorina saxatilis TaxID=31220 RepID=UPI0038B47B8A
MRLVVFCLAVLSWNSAVVHVVAVPVTMSCPEKLEHGASAVVTCEINTVEVASAKCFANPTTVTFVQTSAGKTSTCPTSYTTTNCTASNADANGTCACTGLAGDIKTFTFRFVADKDQHNGAEFECSVCSASPPMEIQQNNCKSLTFDVNLQIVATTHCPDTFVEGGPNLVNCTIYGDRVTCSPTPKKIPIILTQNGNPGVSAGPDYPPTCNPDVGVIPNGEAKCTKKDGNTYTYVYKFMGANKTHKRDTLQCKVPCFGITPDIGNACEIKFEEPTEVGSGTTDTNCNNRGTNSTSSDGKGSSSSNLGLI